MPVKIKKFLDPHLIHVERTNEWASSVLGRILCSSIDKLPFPTQYEMLVW